MKTFLKENKYTLLLIITLFMIYNFGYKMFIIPSESMTNTMKVGDYFIGKKYEYGLRIPETYFFNLKMFPNINNNNYIYKRKNPEYKDIIIFYQPLINKTFIKRCFAKEGDEILLKNDNAIYIHYENNKLNDKNKEYIIYKDKIWIKNPYMNEIKGIHYTKEEKNEYNLLYKLYFENYKQNNLIENKDWKKYLDFNKEKQYFTYKLKKDEYYMIGDNRNNSIDSRFFGPIKFKNIEAKAYKVIFNITEKGRFLKEVK
jgi:signal peptidase I